MNENPGGTPNPLNPNPVPPMRPTGTAPIIQTTPPTTPVNPMAATEPVVTPTATIPTAQMETEPKGSIIEPEKKSKKGLIITLVIFFIVGICGGAAAAIILLNPFGQKDAVPAAISKLLAGEVPNLVAVSGSLNISGDMAPSANVNIAAGFNRATSENYANAKVIVESGEDSDLEFEINETQVADGDIYLKLSGLSNIFGNMTDVDDELNCIYDESGETNCGYEEDLLDTDCLTGDCVEYNPLSPVLGYLSVLESLDDEWIRVPGSILDGMKDSIGLDQPAQCLLNVVGNSQSYSSDFKNLYDKNPFVAYSTKDLKVEKKKDTLYRLSLDADKLANFMNGLTTTAFADELSSCIPGSEISEDEKVTAEDLSELVAEMPEIYVEIDNNNNFTRVFFTINSDAMTATLDLAIAYPDKIEVKEPESYSDIEDILMNIFTTGGFDMPGITDPTNFLDPTDIMDQSDMLNWL